MLSNPDLQGELRTLVVIAWLAHPNGSIGTERATTAARFDTFSKSRAPEAMWLG